MRAQAEIYAPRRQEELFIDPRLDEPKLNMWIDELAMLEPGAREPATDKLSSRYAISNRSAKRSSSMCSTSSMISMHHVRPLGVWD